MSRNTAEFRLWGRAGAGAGAGSRSRRGNRHRLRPAILELEERRLLSTFTVNSTGDTGAGSGTAGDLRYCIGLANLIADANTIVFDSTVFSTPKTITLNGSQLWLESTWGKETIIGPAVGVTVSGDHKSRVFEVYYERNSGEPVEVSISGLTITGGNEAPLFGAGIGGGVENYGGTLSLYNCTVSGNYAEGSGGGIGTYMGGTTKLTNCTVSGNTAASGGGGVFNDFGAMNLTNCTVSGNTAGTDGGGLCQDYSGTMKLTNCTVSGNTALGKPGFHTPFSGNGGGVYNLSVATLTGCTITGNSINPPGGSDNPGGGGLCNFPNINLPPFASMTLTNTIVARNWNVATGGATDISDSWDRVTGSYNLIGTGGSGGLNGGGHNIIGIANPGLSPLGFYGGPTPTMALEPGSKAMHAGTASGVPSTDQRGFALDGRTPDIGAFQSGPLVVNTTSDGNSSPLGALNLRQAANLANVLIGPTSISFDKTVFASTRRSR